MCLHEKHFCSFLFGLKKISDLPTNVFWLCSKENDSCNRGDRSSHIRTRSVGGPTHMYDGQRRLSGWPVMWLIIYLLIFWAKPTVGKSQFGTWSIDGLTHMNDGQRPLFGWPVMGLTIYLPIFWPKPTVGKTYIYVWGISCDWTNFATGPLMASPKYMRDKGILLDWLVMGLII